ncbi:MAG TPA: ABC transporter substrate-binding protein [Deferrisomatales bacterium]|nr:ABC transporter substrate-binding protein [Deferrisomatales bacterium]
MKIRWVWLGIAMLALWGFTVPPQEAQAAKDIKIGFIDAYSGPASVYSNDVADAFQLQADKVNAAGGLFGRKIVVLKKDSKFKVDLSLGHAKEYIMREEVDVLAGTISSSVALAVSALAEKEKIPFFVTFAKSEAITGEQGHRYVFGLAENTAMAGGAAAAVLVKRPYKKYWIAGDDYEYGHAIAKAIWDKLKAAKPDVELMGETWWKVGEPDFTPYITAIRSAKPDMVLLATGGRNNVPFLKAARATGFSQAVPFWLHTATELSTLRPLGAEAPEGVMGTSNYHFFYPDTPANQAFVKEFRAAYNRYPAVGALYGYLAARYIIEGYQKAGAVDKEKLIDAIEGMTVESPVGPVTLRAYDHQAMLPMFLGVTAKDPKYPDFLIAKDVVMIPAADLVPSVEEVKASRKAK